MGPRDPPAAGMGGGGGNGDTDIRGERGARGGERGHGGTELRGEGSEQGATDGNECKGHKWGHGRGHLGARDTSGDTRGARVGT